jgi:hypothetical protein
VRSQAGADEDATIVRIWPEHFDAAIDVGKAAAGRSQLAAAGDPRAEAIGFFAEARRRVLEHD